MLSAAAQREDRCLVAPPALKGAAAQKVVNRLISSGLVKEVKATTGAPIWRRDEEAGQSYALKLTVVGAKAIAIDESLEPEHGDDEGGLLENVDQAAVASTLGALDYPPARKRWTLLLRAPPLHVAARSWPESADCFGGILAGQAVKWHPQ